MTPYKTRALEMHSGYVWNWDRVVAALEFISRNEMTALVLHRNDIVDLMVYPGRTFGSSAGAANIFERYSELFRTLYKYTPTRRSGPYQRRDYMKRVLELAGRRGIKVFLENKELFFADIFLELNPQLTKQGTPCPNDPFWWAFLGDKYRELFEDLPEIAGIITGPGTSESRLAASGSRCTCDLCAASTRQDWYRNLLMAMYAPISKAGRDLIVRDFVFDRNAQTELAETIEGLPGDVIVALKNTPHDYYPTFPDNPRIGDFGERRQWLEFDTMGQYFGWGVAPAILIEDYRARLARAAAKGVEGAIFRTDWESLDGHSSFANLNLVNLYAGAALTQENATPADAIYRRWLEEERLLVPEATEAQKRAATDYVGSLLKDTWEVVSKALFVNDCVFSDSSNYPVSLDHAMWLAEEKNSLQDWVPEKADALDGTAPNLERMLREKDEAVALAVAIRQRLDSSVEGLTDGAHRLLADSMDVSVRYVVGWRAVVRAIMLTRHVLRFGRAARADARRDLALALDELKALAAEFRQFAAATDHRFIVYNMLGWERLLTLHNDLESRISRSTGNGILEGQEA